MSDLQPATTLAELKACRSGLSAAEIVERELALCDGCTGDCPKHINRYIQPVIGADGYVQCPFSKRPRVTNIPPKFRGKTFDDYTVTADNKRAVQLAKRFCECKPNQGLYLFGECGTGKTFLAAIIAQTFGRKTIFGDVPSLLDDIKRTFDGNGSAQEILDRYGNCDLLVLDDIGAGQITDWNIGQLYQIVNARYNAVLPTVVTSNYDLNGLVRRLSLRDDLTAKRIISRLSEMTAQAFLGTTDRRRF